MQGTSSRRPGAARRDGWSAHGALLVGAATGSASGPETACELSAALAWEGGCVPTGAAAGALGGALLGLLAAPLSRSGRRPGQSPAHPPAATTWAAAGLMLAALAAVVSVWPGEWRAAEGTLDRLSLSVAGLGIAGVGVVLLVLTWGLLGRRGWARWGVVVGFSLTAIAALVALAAQGVGVAGNRWLDQPLSELDHPVVFPVVSVAVVVLVPPTAPDLAASRQAPLRDAGPRQGSDAPWAPSSRGGHRPLLPRLRAPPAAGCLTRHSPRMRPA